VINARGQVVAAHDTDPSNLAGARRTLRTGRRVRDVVAQGSSAEARVAVPVTIDGRRFALALSRHLETVQTAVATIRRAMLAAALVGLLVALLVGVGLAGGLVRRLRRVRDTALRVARLGPVVEIVPETGRDEIADLTRAFAVMQQRLREQEDARRTFIATASHELRTPLTSLRLLLDLLSEELAAGAADPRSVSEQVDHASALTARISALAAQLLDLSRLDAGVPLRQELIELRETCRAVIAEFAARAAETDRGLVLRAGGPLWAVADPDSVAQIVRVLIDNALRFAPAGTAVYVELIEDGRACAVAVHDGGPGVPAAEREEIFARFRRGSETGGEGGFGLGLAIARELAHRMDGDVVLADSTGGASFELQLVAAPAQADLTASAR
jgi:signal transduction histidine kinase